MAHVTKFSKGCGGLGHLISHFEREKNELGQYINFSNQEIDTSKTHLNYNLSENNMQASEILERCQNHSKRAIRDDMNIMCSWVVTKPQDLSQDKTKEFFEQSYKFLENRYGKENVISSFVHLDETTPHMHFAFTPITKEGKLTAKEVVSRSDLKSFHPDLENYLENYFKHKINILNGATINGNKSIQELKTSTQNLEKEIKILQNKKNSLKNELNSLNKAIKEQTLSINQINNIKPEKTAFNTIKGITLSDIDKLKQMSIDSVYLKSQNNKLILENEKLKKRIPKKESIDIKQKKALEKLRLEKIEKAFNKLPKEKQQELLSQDKFIKKGLKR